MSITIHAELEQLTKLGEVSDPKEVPPCDPFSSQSPYPVDASLFYEAVEVANALIEGTPQGEEIIDFSKPILRPTEEDDSECECGGTYDEYDRCSDCDNGHSDCELQECFACFERAQDRAERMAEGDER